MKVLISAPYFLGEPMKRFQPLFDRLKLEVIVPDVNERLEEDELIQLAKEHRVVAALSGDDRWTAAAFAAFAPDLKVLVKWGTGIDSFDQAAAAQHNVVIRRTPNAFTLPVADSVLGYMLAFARQQPWMDRAMKSGQWQKWPGKSLSECTVGVIGVGNCGRAVLRRARAFGMRLIGYDVLPPPTDFLAECRVELVSNLDDLLRQSDFVSLNCDLNAQSQHIINKTSLAKMKPTAVLINTARGPLVDEPALCEALANKSIGGAGLDVFEHEPLPVTSPLMKLDNVMMAPHNANSSPAAWERVHWSSLRQMFEALQIPFSDQDQANYIKKGSSA